MQSRDYLRGVHFTMLNFIHDQQPELIYLKKATVGGILVLVPVSDFLTHDHLQKPFLNSALHSINQGRCRVPACYHPTALRRVQITRD